ncbi:citrate lyase beta subunit [Gelidibacter sediminis]|uniref:Citrate lyase beta subunit n=1 Tax=Gelidibacter sediminis TaxID=1608710 RepID=A0A4V6Q4P6_9FLAO|nr:aldolase/citrate lyase family protein [Gelidibacter sediminis]TDU42896.1 citrate lyase beta subunit [Gelidibacter sediminis]
MKSYFFIPASRLRKLKDIKKSSADEIIIDFEDAIINSELETYFEEIKTNESIESYWFRIPLRNGFDDLLNLNYISKFYQIGVKQMILPKIKSAAELLEIIDKFQSIEYIILIEHPRLLLEIQDVLMRHPRVFKSIMGIGMGSHDLMTFLNAEHTKLQLDYPRKKVLYLAKAYNLQAIDIASMDIYNKESFIDEVRYAEDNGYDAKFLIHPTQLEWFKQETGQDKELVGWARNVVAHLPENYNGESLEPFILNEEIIEKPHALRALEILKNKKYGK